MADPREDAYLVAALLSELERVLHPLQRASGEKSGPKSCCRRPCRRPRPRPLPEGGSPAGRQGAVLPLRRPLRDCRGRTFREPASPAFPCRPPLRKPARGSARGRHPRLPASRHGRQGRPEQGVSRTLPRAEGLPPGRLLRHPSGGKRRFTPKTSPGWRSRHAVPAGRNSLGRQRQARQKQLRARLPPQLGPHRQGRRNPLLPQFVLWRRPRVRPPPAGRRSWKTL